MFKGGKIEIRMALDGKMAEGQVRHKEQLGATPASDKPGLQD